MEPIVLGPSVPDLDPTLGGPNRPNRVHALDPSNPPRSPRDGDPGHAIPSRLRLLDPDALSARRGDVFKSVVASDFASRDASMTPTRLGASGFPTLEGVS